MWQRAGARQMNRKERRRAAAVTHPVVQSVEHADAARRFHDAVQLLKSGRLAESEVAHRRVLSLVPNHAPSLHHLGLIAYKRQDHVGAVDLIRRSLSVKPDYHEAWLNLAIVLGEMQRSKEAIEACRECLSLQPRNAEPHVVLGNLLRVAEREADAMTAYMAALELKPDQPLVLTRLAELLLKAGDTAAAAARCSRALEIDPNLAEARSLARRVSASSRSAGAIAAEIESQAKTAPDRAKALDDFATHLRAERRYADAADLSRRAVAAMPEVADHHFNLALALEGLGRLDEAFASYQAGLALEPNRAEAYASLGTLLRTMNMHTGAIQALEHAVTLDPNLADAHYNLAITFKQREKFEEARAAFQKCLECAPDAIVNRFEYVNLRRLLCDWKGVDEEEQACLEIFREKEVCIAPFQLISLWATAADQLRAAQGYAKTFAVPNALRFSGHATSLGVGRRIRIGFLSCDFFEHATAILFAEVLEKLDRNRFEIFGYCYSPDDRSPMRQRLLDAFEHVRKIGTVANRDAANAIHADAIDILVDLKGYTKDARTEILAYRPAPIQVNYLGYPGTMGADCIDYILADAIVAPMDSQPNYSERIVHLPNSYQPNDRQRPISDEPVSRADCGLPEDAFVFCSFNNSYKLNTRMFDIWMPLLQKVPGSVLWLLIPNETAAGNLRREAQSRGIDPERLVFAKRAPIAKHLARHRLADLFLDALPCNAHTTTSDALWAGLPVLTCLGETFAGRVAGSLLNAMGVPELITANADEYSRRALELARDKDQLDAIRKKLATDRDTAPLFDSTRYTRNLEKSFEMMLDIRRAGDPPQPFAVVESDPLNVAAQPVSQAPPALREHYDGCPLCGGRDTSSETEARITNHPRYNSALPPIVKWHRCRSCAHTFADGYLSPAGVALIQVTSDSVVGKDAERNRKDTAKIVSRIARELESPLRNGEWLDIEFGNASLLFTAAEWGFTPVGVDANDANVQKLRRFGYEACRDVAEIQSEARFCVVSMRDCLDHVPYPDRTLKALHRTMRPGGIVFLSLPNRDTIVWRALDASGANPYGADPERYHVFTRARLAALLQEHGFELLEYGISEEHRSAMEILALKTKAA